MDIGHVRHDFNDHQPLEREQLADDPIVQFAKWFDEALGSAMAEPNAFVLATVGPDGRPSQRTVLLKYFDHDGFVFYTNYHSRKAKEIAENAAVSMLFPWFGLQRQVKIEGVAEKVSRAQSLRYFLSRPKDSQLGAWASPQSQVINSRTLLMQQWAKMKEKFAEGDVPLPDFWGGYRIRPHSIEFWQGQPNRLHDRFVYQLSSEKDWFINRLAP
ncbi:pyridoxamine 5'-phosphate oxidase [Cardiobacteriaceae bacterium TAE3-ERU3]|nr:pyridoxamine 5'-phosphate oxidase [Cardiobacteriaceae bacterium TAE3-ERU3]